MKVPIFLTETRSLVLATGREEVYGRPPRRTLLSEEEAGNVSSPNQYSPGST